MGKSLFNRALLILAFPAISFLAFAQETVLTEMNEFYPEEIRVSGFTLSGDQDLNIEATALEPRWNYRQYGLSYAWILNASSREMVWELTDASVDERDRYIAKYSDNIKLPAGNYEIYYSTYPFYGNDWDGHRGFGGVFNGFFSAIFDDDDDRRFFDEEYEELAIKINGSGTAKTEDDVEKWQSDFKENAFLNFTALRDEELHERVIEVKQPVTLNVYALGEARRDGDYDFGWIVDMKNREKIWRLDYRHSDHAGGAIKNRVSRENLQLEPGTYKILYATDDSHSYRRWNSPPPYDPNFWGITLWFEDKSATANVAVIDFESDREDRAIVEFTKVRDSEYLSEGFTLKKAVDVNIYALGEGSDGDMYDYGWIVNANTHKTVWKMDFDETEFAGGSSKNRLFDGVVHLDAGNYLAYYITDGSHAYHSWNDSEPFDRKHWGMSLFAMDPDFSADDFTAYEEKEDPSILAKLTRIGDYDRERAKFSLTDAKEIHIYALGEGTHGEMYDYAWIENVNTGKVVWEMTYRKTERAGGARKNRLFDDVILLPAGEYVVIYESDDSHSFNDWNDRPPRDPFNWGVTVSLAEGI